MGIISREDAPQFEARLKKLVGRLEKSRKAEADDVRATREFMDWLIYPGWDEQETPDARPIAWSDGIPPEARQALVVLTLAAAGFVHTGRRGEKETLCRSCERVMQLCGIQRPQRPGDVKLLDKQTEARDKFVYERVMKGAPLGQIQESVAQHPKWVPLDDKQSLLDCARAYSERHGLEPPQRG